MANQLKILMIEDEEKNKEAVERAFIDTLGKLKEWNLLDEMKIHNITFEWLRGTDKVIKRGKEYFFYTNQVLDELEVKIAEQTDDVVGILLDVVLTREEQEKCDVNDFSRIELSRKIYDRFEKKCNLYLITGLRSFGTLAWGIFEREAMKDRYIPRELVGDYTSCMAISQALYYLNSREQISNELLKKIEEKELME